MSTSTSSPSSSSSSKPPPLKSLSVGGPTPRPPPSLASPQNTTSRRITSWGSINSIDSSNLGEKGFMTPLPSPMESLTREWGYLSSSNSTTTIDRSWQKGGVGGGYSSWGRKSMNGRWDGGDFDHSPTTTKSWMSNFNSPVAVGVASTTPLKSPPLPTTAAAPSTSTSTRELPTRSKTLSFFETSPVITPSSSNGGVTDPSVLLLSPPPPLTAAGGGGGGAISRNNSLSSSTTTSRSRNNNTSYRPRSSSRLSISDLPGSEEERVDDSSHLRMSTNSTNSWLEDYNNNNNDKSTGTGSSRRTRVTSIGSWSDEVNRIARLRTETNGTTSTTTLAVERRLFIDSKNDGHDYSKGLETVKNSPDRPRLTQLDTSFNSPDRGTAAAPNEGRLRTISSSNSNALNQPLSSLPTAVEPCQYSPLPPPRVRSSREREHESRSSPPTRIDLPLSLEKLVVVPVATPRTPPSIEELRNIMGQTELKESALSGGVEKGDVIGEYKVLKLLGKGSFSRVALATKEANITFNEEGKLVALKLMERKSCESNERMRISVLREVQVLKTISHPSLVRLESSFFTKFYTVLCLDFCQGGELFDFLQEWSQQVTEGLARRIFSELCDAVGWMHRVGLVHRDIKLENILLTRQLFPLTTSSLTSSLNPLDHLPRGGRFIKLTDFGLSRFVDPTNSQLLSTRCGSEAYAAPELLMGKLYDGTLTDSWAVGVVLYAIVTGELPFIEQPQEEGTLTMGGGEKKERGDGGLERRISSTKGGRKGYLLKIAKAEYTWPMTSNSRKIEIGKELKELVGKLLVRDPNKRWRIDSQQLWECEWMNKGEGKVERIEGTINRVE